MEESVGSPGIHNDYLKYCLHLIFFKAYRNLDLIVKFKNVIIFFKTRDHIVSLERRGSLMRKFYYEKSDIITNVHNFIGDRHEANTI